jgi:hypothetical protein
MIIALIAELPPILRMMKIPTLQATNNPHKVSSPVMLQYMPDHLL